MEPDQVMFTSQGLIWAAIWELSKSVAFTIYRRFLARERDIQVQVEAQNSDKNQEMGDNQAPVSLYSSSGNFKNMSMLSTQLACCSDAVSPRKRRLTAVPESNLEINKKVRMMAESDSTTSDIHELDSMSSSSDRVSKI